MKGGRKIASTAADVVDHVVQLVHVMLVKLGNVRQEVRFCLLCLNCRFELGDLHRVVCGQRERCGCSAKSDDVPLSALSLVNMGKAC